MSPETISKMLADCATAQSKPKRVTELQAQAWQAIDAKFTQIENLSADGFLKIRVQELKQMINYWRKRIEQA